MFSLLFFIMCAVVPVQQCRKRGHAAAAVWAEDDLARERELDLDRPVVQTLEVRLRHDMYL